MWRDVSGIMAEPPIPGRAYTVLLPQVDADGNPIDGLRNTNVQVPPRYLHRVEHQEARIQRGDSCDLDGRLHSVLQDQSRAGAAGDPRLSLEERYPTHDDYVAKVTAAANDLVSKRLLLPEDAVSSPRQTRPPFPVAEAKTVHRLRGCSRIEQPLDAGGLIAL